MSVCLFFRTISQKLMQLRSPNMTKKCSMTSPGNPFILGSEGQRSRSRVTKTLRRGSLHSCECWFLVVTSIVGFSVEQAAVRQRHSTLSSLGQRVLSFCEPAAVSQRQRPVCHHVRTFSGTAQHCLIVIAAVASLSVCLSVCLSVGDVRDPCKNG